MPWTQAECLAIAESVGFSADAAGIMCQTAQGESGTGSTNACACQACCSGDCSHGCGPVYHDAECDALGYDKHCGIFQWSPQWAISSHHDCLGDLTCELKYAFGVTNGGQCFQPWAGDTSGNTDCTPNYGAQVNGSGVSNIESSGNDCGPNGQCPSPYYCADKSATSPGTCVKQTTFGPNKGQVGSSPATTGGGPDPFGLRGAITGAFKALGLAALPAGVLIAGLAFIFVGIMAATHSTTNVVNTGKAAGKAAIFA